MLTGLFDQFSVVTIPGLQKGIRGDGDQMSGIADKAAVPYPLGVAVQSLSLLELSFFTDGKNIDAAVSRACGELLDVLGDLDAEDVVVVGLELLHEVQIVAIDLPYKTGA